MNLRIASTAHGLLAASLCMLAIQGTPHNSMIKNPYEMVIALYLFMVAVVVSNLWMWLRPSKGAVVSALSSNIAATLCSFLVFGA